MNDNNTLVLTNAFLRRMQRDRVYRPHRIPEINGLYLVIKDTPYFKRGTVLDSQNGWVHGVWQPIKKEMIMFTNSEHFEPYLELSPDEIVNHKP